MSHSHFCLRAIVLTILMPLCCIAQAQSSRPAVANTSVPHRALLSILKAEDERRWDSELRNFLGDRDAAVRRRAALAAGRIGDQNAVEPLVQMLGRETNDAVKAMAAFALGEIESAAGAEALLTLVEDTKAPGPLRARAVEALGKIAAALGNEQETRKRELGGAVVKVLEFEAGRRSLPDSQTILLGLTAALRCRPANAGPVIVKFLSYSDSRVRADAANALARLRAKEGLAKLRELAARDPDAIVRANAARALGAAEDKDAVDVLIDLALDDRDLRVRVSAIRALNTLKDRKTADPLMRRFHVLVQSGRNSMDPALNEGLEIVTTLGTLLQGTANKDAVASLIKLAERVNHRAPEIEIALARIAPAEYLRSFGAGQDAVRKAQKAIMLDWKSAASMAEGLGEIVSLPETINDRAKLIEAAQNILRGMLDYRNSGITINTLVAVHSEYAVPEVLRALAAYKPNDLGDVLRQQLSEPDVIVRATAADSLGELPPDETNATALAKALPQTANDALNDAALSILDSLAKQKMAPANEAIQTMIDAPDYLIRKRAITLLKANGAGDYSSHLGRIKTRNTSFDYERALARIDREIRATVATTRGSFVIELLPNDAPLNVDNFVQLARKHYFDGLTVPRVVPNFVIQTGDPRGDQNGGPGFQIRCEINEVPYERGTVGMALSGKDTGGSQWFVTHSRQPHLDGGYTVFGSVISGMDVVDRIERGDIIKSIVITEGRRNTRKR